MPFVIRPAERRDYPAVAELKSFARGQKITVADLVESDIKTETGSFTHRVVGEVDGKIVGTGTANHSTWLPPGIYRIAVAVAYQHGRQTYGSQIADQLEQESESRGATILEARVRDDDPAGLAFLEKRGYNQIAHTYEAILNVERFRPEAFERDPLGLRLFSYSETPMGEAEKRKLWDLNSETSCDEPKNDSNHRPTFEDFCGSVIGASWFDPAGQFFAADGDEWVGMSAIGRVFDGEFYNLFTGVRRSYRGRGIAMALKLMATKWAKEMGAKAIRTNNDSRNAAMIAINSKLGYVSEPGWIMGRKLVGP